MTRSFLIAWRNFWVADEFERSEPISGAAPNPAVGVDSGISDGDPGSGSPSWFQGRSPIGDRLSYCLGGAYGDGGGTQPPNTRSSSSATAIDTWSRSIPAATLTPS